MLEKTASNGNTTIILYAYPTNMSALASSQAKKEFSFRASKSVVSSAFPMRNPAA